jgi:hypothetical protein
MVFQKQRKVVHEVSNPTGAKTSLPRSQQPYTGPDLRTISNSMTHPGVAAASS